MFYNDSLFAAALQIEEPLYVKEIKFNQDLGELHIHIEFRKGSNFQCVICGKEGLPVHDDMEQTWRHLNFFQYRAYIHCPTPRSNCPEHGVRMVDVPWVSDGIGFSLVD